MSKKTIFKRIALTAVSALAAGTLSVVVVPAASALDNVAPGTASPNFAENVLNMGTTANATGSAVTTATNGAPSSLGLVATSDISGGRVAGTTQTAVLLSSGTLVVYSKTASSAYGIVTVENGTISGGAAGDAINSSLTAVVATGSAEDFTVAVRPASGATTMTVRLYTGAATTWSTSAAAALAAPTLGTLSGQITVTIASASVAGVVSPALSKIYYSDATVDSTDDGQTADADASVLNLGGLGCLNIQLNDGYGQDITSATGLLTATATNNAVLAFAAADCAAGTTAGSAFQAGSTATPADVVLSVAAPSSAPLSTTVTISYNGIVIGSRTFIIKGKVSKVTITGGTIGKAAGTSNAAAGSVKFEDAAGNTIYPTSSSTVYPLNTSTFTMSPASPAKLIASAAIDDTIIPNASTGVTGAYKFSCTASSYGKEKMAMIYVNTDGSVITSNEVENSCAGSPVFYSAGWDKASYAPGELMKLLITVKDAKGNLANDYDAIGTSTASTDPVFDGAPNAGVNIGTLKDGLDVPVSGVLTYRFIAGTTEGTFASLISLPNLNSALTGQAAQTTSYTIKASSTAVSTNEVLAAIVKLIATINKQIRQLQKQLRR